MLYQRTANDLIHGFHDWVKQQDPQKRYDYSGTTSCAFATYLKEQGYVEIYVGMDSFAAGDRLAAFPAAFADALLGSSVEAYYLRVATETATPNLPQGCLWTYGELDKRLTEAGY